jgi:hypothetical protein
MKYRYEGPLSGVTVREDGVSRETPLVPGSTVDLPQDAGFVRVMLASGGLLTPLSPTSAPWKENA